MKRKADSGLHREDFLENHQVNSHLRHSQNNFFNRGNIFPRRAQRTGRGLLFESAMKRFEEVGKNAWEIQMSTSNIPLSEIEQRRIVKLKLPSEILKERSARIIEEPPKNVNLGESFISGNQQHLDSTSAEINTSATSFSFSRFIAPTPIQQNDQLDKSNPNELSSIQSEHNAFPQGSQSLTQSQEITVPDQNAEGSQSISNVSSQEKRDQFKPQESVINKPVSIFGGDSSLLKQTERGPSTGLFGQVSNSGGLFSSTIGSTKSGVQENPLVSTLIPSGDSVQPKPSSGLFGQTSGASVFASNVNVAKTPQETVTGQKPLFGNEPSQLRPVGGLFGSVSALPSSNLVGVSLSQKEQKEAIQPLINQELPKTGLFSNNVTPKPSEGLFATNKPEEKKEEPKGGLLANSSAFSSSSGLFGATSKPEQKGGLFAGSNNVPQTTAGNLFANNKPEEKKEEPKGGLFANIAAPKPSGGLFAHTVEQKKEEPNGGFLANIAASKSSDLFSGSVEQMKEPRGGLFSNLPASKPKSPESNTSDHVEEEEGKEKPKINYPATGLFSNLDAEQKTSYTKIDSKPTSGPFAPHQKKEDQPKAGGLFSSYLSQKSGENNLTTNKPEEKKEEPKGGLFSNLTSTNKPSESIEEEKPEGLVGNNATPSGGLFAPKKSEEKKEEQKSGLFGNTNISQSSGGLFANNPEIKKVEQKGGLFGNTNLSQPPGGAFVNTAGQKKEEPKSGLYANTAAPKSSGVFAGATEEKKEEQKGGLFGNTSPSKPSGGLFASNKPEQMKEEVKETKLPATVESNAPKAGLFSSFLSQKPLETAPTQNEKEAAEPEPKKEEKPATTGPTLPRAGFFSSTPTGNKFSPEKSQGEKEATKPGLFGSAVSSSGAGTGLFGSSSGQTQTAAPNLFSKDHKSSLFADKPSGGFTSLFGSGPSAPVQSGSLFGKPKEDEDVESDEGEEGDDEPERSPSPEADVTKSKGNYQYQQNYDKIASQKLNKFKPGLKSLLPEGEVSLNKMNENVFFIIYRNKAKVIQYQGQLIKKVSITKYLNERHDAMSVTAFSEDKTESKEKSSKLSKDELKMMFPTSEQCDEFKKAIDKVLN